MRNFDFDRIEKRYDPVYDTRKDGPPVTWAEKALHDAVRALEKRVLDLEGYIDAKASALEMAQSLGLDDAIRTVADSGRNYDHGPNWYVEWNDLAISATFNAGIDSACVSVVSDDVTTNHMLLYLASDFGRHIETFRHGPWVHRLIFHANVLRQANEEGAQRVLDSFREVPF